MLDIGEKEAIIRIEISRPMLPSLVLALAMRFTISSYPLSSAAMNITQDLYTICNLPEFNGSQRVNRMSSYIIYIGQIDWLASVLRCGEITLGTIGSYLNTSRPSVNFSVNFSRYFSVKISNLSTFPLRTSTKHSPLSSVSQKWIPHNERRGLDLS